MDAVHGATRRWLVSAQPVGEVLIARAGIGEIMVLLFAEASSAPERGWIESQLRESLEVARDAARSDEVRGALPTLFRHVLARLLMADVGLGDSKDLPWGSVILFDSGDEVGIGLMGVSEQHIWINTHLAQVPWVRLKNRKGGEALAYTFDSGDAIGARVSWQSQHGAGVRLEAEWRVDDEGWRSSFPHSPEASKSKRPPAAELRPKDAADAQASADTQAHSVEPVHEAEGDANPPDAPAPKVAPVPRAGTSDRGIKPFFGWLDRMVSRREKEPMTDRPLPQAEAKTEMMEPGVIHDPGPLPAASPPPVRVERPAPPGTTVRKIVAERGPAPPVHAERRSPPQPVVLVEPGAQLEPPPLAPTSPPAPSPQAEREWTRLQSQSPEPPALGGPPPLAERFERARSAHVESPIRDAQPEHSVHGESASSEIDVHTIDSPSASWEEIQAATVGETIGGAHDTSMTQGVPWESDPGESDPATAEATWVEPMQPTPKRTGTGARAARASLRPMGSNVEPLRPTHRRGGAATRGGPSPIRPTWPSLDDLESKPQVWKKPWLWGAVALVLIAVVWLMGGFGTRRENQPSFLTHALRGLGIGGSVFDVTINSRPPGARIAVDGRDLNTLTPATIALAPGSHQVTLSLTEHGDATFQVQGSRGQHQKIDAPLWGSLSIMSDSPLPISVSVDGVERGFAPLAVDSLLPGPHQVSFSGPGFAPWGQTVEVRVREQSQIVAQPFSVPERGRIDVRATLASAGEAETLKGASVWIDGELRGATPLTIELPSGPHSVRVAYKGEEAAVQVVNLPGGNHRYAEFLLGTGAEGPRLMGLGSPGVFPRDRPAVVSGMLSEVSESEVREMWLHVRTPEATWRRYQMTMLPAPGGIVGVVVFPIALLDDDGRATYYMSAVTQMGDEYFTELNNPRARRGTSPARPYPGRVTTPNTPPETP